MMVSFVLSFFPRDVLDEILNLIESVSEDFPSYFSFVYKILKVIIESVINNESVIRKPLIKVDRKAKIRNFKMQSPSKQKGKQAHIKLEKYSRKTHTANRMNSSFPKRWGFSYPN